MKVCLIENNLFEEVGIRILNVIVELESNENACTVAILNKDIKQEDIEKYSYEENENVCYFDLLAEDFMIERFLRVNKEVVFLNFFGSTEEMKRQIFDSLRQYTEYFEKKLRFLVIIEDKMNLSKVAMEIESFLYVKAINWKEKEYKKIFKKQRKELRRFKYIYEYKYIFGLFKLLGKVKKTLRINT